MLLVCLQSNSDDKTLYSIILQNAETVALINPCEGLPKLSFMLQEVLDLFFVSSSYKPCTPMFYRKWRAGKSYPCDLTESGG